MWIEISKENTCAHKDKVIAREGMLHFSAGKAVKTHSVVLLSLQKVTFFYWHHNSKLSYIKKEISVLRPLFLCQKFLAPWLLKYIACFLYCCGSGCSTVGPQAGAVLVLCSPQHDATAAAFVLPLRKLILSLQNFKYFLLNLQDLMSGQKYLTVSVQVSWNLFQIHHISVRVPSTEGDVHYLTLLLTEDCSLLQDLSCLPSGESDS